MGSVIIVAVIVGIVFLLRLLHRSAIRSWVHYGAVKYLFKCSRRTAVEMAAFLRRNGISQDQFLYEYKSACGQLLPMFGDASMGGLYAPSGDVRAAMERLVREKRYKKLPEPMMIEMIRAEVMDMRSKGLIGANNPDDWHRGFC